MNWIDIVIIVTASAGGILGWRVGIIRVAFTIIGCILGVILAGQLGENLGNQMGFIENQNATLTFHRNNLMKLKRSHM